MTTAAGTPNLSWQGRIRSYNGLRLLRLPLPSRLLVTVGAADPPRGLRDTVGRAIAGGAGMIALGGGARTTREMVDETVQVVWTCRGRQVPCLIQGRVDVALAVMADGVQLSPHDMPVALARRMLGPAATIGVTCRSLADAIEARREGASYVRLDHLAQRDSGLRRESLHLLTDIIERAGLPVCLGGEIGLDNLALLRDAPAFLFAVDATVTQALDPQSMAQALRESLDGTAGRPLSLAAARVP